MITLYIIFIIILFVDVLFYIPLKFHILISKDEFAIYFFNIPLVLISSQKKINRLKNKIPPIDFKNIDTADIKYIEAINLEKLYINFDMQNLNYQFYPFLYPFLGLILNANELIDKTDLKINIKTTQDYYLYCLIEIKLAKLIEEHLIVRRIKNERTSTK